MELETNKTTGLGADQKQGSETVKTDETPGIGAGQKLCSGDNQKLVEICQNTVVETDVNPENQTDQKPGVIYRCKRCRRIVATQEYVVPHDVGRGEECFQWHKRDHKTDDDKKPECTCIFVEPMKWMEAVEEGCVAEKLWCMGCKARLGSFNWAGMQCSCGAWVNPAFQLLKSKVDECLI